ILFREVRDDLGVGFGDKLVTFLLQLFLELEIVFDNSVVDDDDLAGAIAMRVGVFLGRPAMGGPARVADAVRAFQRGLGDDFFEIAKFTRGAADFHLARLRHNRDARGIITAVFKLAETLNDDGHNFFWPDVTSYSAHTR